MRAQLADALFALAGVLFTIGETLERWSFALHDAPARCPHQIPVGESCARCNLAAWHKDVQAERRAH